MEAPLISVIMPCYNHEKYVEQSIRSVISQPFKNLELIAIDDGSQDGTPEIIRRLGEAYGFTFALQKENRGVCHTLNTALDRARGRYIKFLASDDFLHDRSLSDFIAYMEGAPGIEACFGDLVEVDKNGATIGFLKSGIQQPFRQRFPVDDVTEISVDMALQISPILGPSYLFRKSLLKSFGRFDETQIVEDWDLFLHLVSHAKPLAYLPAIAGYYRRFTPQDKPIRRDNRKWFFSDLKTVEKYKDYAAKASFESAIKNIVKLHAAIAVTCGESPLFLLRPAKRYLFLWTLCADGAFLVSILKLYRKKRGERIRNRTHR